MSNTVLDNVESQLRDCLTHFYDYAFLQNHPLVHALVTSVPDNAHRTQKFRTLILQAIESLKPAAGIDSSSKPVRFYSIIMLRYLKQHSIQQIINELHLGERQFYRDHNQAIHTLSQVVWEHVKGVRSASDNIISIKSEIHRIHMQTRPEKIEVGAFLQKNLDAIRSLADRYQAHFQLRVSNQALILSNNRGALGQTLILIVSQLIVQSAPNSNFILAFEVHGENAEFTFGREGSDQAAHPLLLLSEQQDTLNNLVQALEGRIEQFSQEGHEQIRLTIPMRHRFILIIDDNPDVIDIFQTYLTDYPYQVLTASAGDLALQMAIESAPELIVLDLMLPQQDGWEILRSLKNHPSTERIPVLICSVLDMAELARDLGADGFLRKPPGEAEFLDTLVHLHSPGLLAVKNS